MGGLIHGEESWNFSGWPSHPLSRHEFLRVRTLSPDNAPPPPLECALLKVNDLDMAQLYSQGSVHNDAPGDTDKVTIHITRSREPGPQSTIHGTVRLLIAKRKEPCVLLRGWWYGSCRIPEEGVFLNVWSWDMISGIFEDRLSNWETLIYGEWIKREDQVYRDFNVSTDSKGALSVERFTAFLSRCRRKNYHHGNPTSLFAPLSCQIEQITNTPTTNNLLMDYDEHEYTISKRLGMVRAKTKRRGLALPSAPSKGPELQRRKSANSSSSTFPYVGHDHSPTISPAAGEIIVPGTFLRPANSFKTNIDSKNSTVIYSMEHDASEGKRPVPQHWLKAWVDRDRLPPKIGRNQYSKPREAVDLPRADHVLRWPQSQDSGESAGRDDKEVDKKREN